MSYRKLGMHEILIEPGQDSSTDIYILAAGHLKVSKYTPSEQYLEDKDLLEKDTDLLSIKNNTRTIDPPEMFGNLSVFNGDAWGELYVYSTEEDTEVIIVDQKKTAEHVGKVAENKENSDLIAILDQAIPGFASRLNSNKAKMAQLFTAKQFIGSQTIAQQGEILNEAFIVTKGKCKIISTGIPRLFEDEGEAQPLIENVRVNLANNKGYFSDTTNSFQLCDVGEQEWAGFEILVYRD